MNATLATYNYRALREAGISPARAYLEADTWAAHDVEVHGHQFRDGKLIIRLCSTREGAEPYEKEFHL